MWEEYEPKIKTVKCNRCGHEWCPRVENPTSCPGCKSPYWNKERVRPIKKDK